MLRIESGIPEQHWHLNVSLVFIYLAYRLVELVLVRNSAWDLATR